MDALGRRWKKEGGVGVGIRLSGAVLGAGNDGRRRFVNLDGTEHIMSLFRLSYKIMAMSLIYIRDTIILLPPRL